MTIAWSMYIKHMAREHSQMASKIMAMYIAVLYIHINP